MDLYIGNATRQVFDFAYRILEEHSLRIQKIQPATQQRISGDLTQEDIDYILKQHARYGLINQDAIDRARQFSGICYSVGKPVTATRLAYLMDHNLGQLVAQGQEIRRVNAVAQNQNFERALTESGRPERIETLDITVQQENADPKNDIPQFSSGLLVTRNGEPRAPRSPGRSTRRKAA